MVSFLAPDQNPAGVQGFGTEHNNLVISWKVINMYLYNLILFNPSVFFVLQGERVVMSFPITKLSGSLHPHVFTELSPLAAAVWPPGQRSRASL